MGGKVPFSISHESSGILLDVLGAWLPPLPSLKPLWVALAQCGAGSPLHPAAVPGALQKTQVEKK